MVIDLESNYIYWNSDTLLSSLIPHSVFLCGVNNWPDDNLNNINWIYSTDKLEVQRLYLEGQ